MIQRNSVPTIRLNFNMSLKAEYQKHACVFDDESKSLKRLI